MPLRVPAAVSTNYFMIPQGKVAMLQTVDIQCQYPHLPLKISVPKKKAEKTGYHLDTGTSRLLIEGTTT